MCCITFPFSRIRGLSKPCHVYVDSQAPILQSFPFSSANTHPIKLSSYHGFLLTNLGSLDVKLVEKKKCFPKTYSHWALEDLGIPRNYLPESSFHKNGVPETFCHQLELVSHLSVLLRSPFLMGQGHLLAEGETQRCRGLYRFVRGFYKLPQMSNSSLKCSSQHIALVQ